MARSSELITILFGNSILRPPVPSVASSAPPPLQPSRIASGQVLAWLRPLEPTSFWLVATNLAEGLFGFDSGNVEYRIESCIDRESAFAVIS